MFYYLIPIIIIIASLFAIVFLVIKKFSHLATINVDSIPAEKNSAAKNRIILERLSRKTVAVQKLAVKIFKPILKTASEAVAIFYQQIMRLEKLKMRSANPLKEIDAQQEAKDVLVKAEGFLDEEKTDEAESAYIKAIELDQGNWEAYVGLVKVYLEDRDYRKARETCRFSLKLLSKLAKGDNSSLKHQLACSHADLGSIYQLENKPVQALKSFEKAVIIEPNNPRFLDLLLKVSIMLKRKDLSEKTFQALKEADPDNQKLSELEAEIAALPAVEAPEPVSSEPENTPT